MSDETFESTEAPADEQATDTAGPCASLYLDGEPRIGTALSVLWWEERAPSSGE